MNIRIYGKQYGSRKFKKFTFQTELSKLERLSGIRLPDPSYKEGESIEEHMMAIENCKERFFSELSDYLAKVFDVGENEIIRAESYVIIP